jgi:hypothetical protein
MAGVVGRAGLGLASSFAMHPVQTARGALQVMCFGSVAAWIGFGFYGWYLAKYKGEPQAERVYDTCGDNLTGTTTAPGGAATDAATGDMADTGGSVDNWITDGLACAGVPDSAENHAAMAALIDQESSGDPLRIQQVYDINNTLPGAGGFSDNLARGLTQITPQTWEATAPDKFKPAKDWIFKPRANVCVSALYQMATYGGLVGHGGY